METSSQLPEPIKIEAISDKDSSVLREALDFNSDQDDCGSNIWDFTDEDFNESSESSNISDSMGLEPQDTHFDDDETELALDLHKKAGIKSKIQEKELEFEERFGMPKKLGEQENEMNQMFFENLDWRKVNYDFPFAIPGIKDFDVKDGVQVESLLEETRPEKFFQEFLKPEFFDEVARLTNIAQNLDPKKKDGWEEVTPEEIKTFFGILFLFGLMKKPNMPAYWSTDSLVSTECLSRIMNYSRFQKIKKYITFYDKSKPKPNNGDTFYKIRMFQDHVLDNSKRVYIPERDLSVDESIILYTGLHRLKVYMPMKPTRYGFKAFVLSEASTGYICNLMMNEGRLKGSEELHSKKVVLDILKGYEDKGYRVYMDRWYSSSELYMEMKRKGIGACGTILVNRVKMDKNLLKEIKDFKTPDACMFYTNDHLMFTVFYHYKRQVHMISNFHDNSITKVEKIKKLRGFDRKDYKVYNYETPVMIRDYQFKMKGVDLFNQRASYYSVNFRSMRWYFRIVYFYMEIAMVNSYLIYMKIMAKNNKKAKTHAEYRIHVLKTLINWKGPSNLDITNTDFQRNQLKLTSQTCKKNYDPGLLDLKRISFQNAEVSLECELEKSQVGGKCIACRPKNKSKKSFWKCKICLKFCCRGPCFLRHKLITLLKGLNDKNVGLDFLNTLINSGKVHIFQDSQEINKLEKTDIEECRLKKQAILEYRKSLNQNEENKDMESEQSKSIGDQEIDNLSNDGEKSESNVIKRGRKPKIKSDVKKDIILIDKEFPRKKGRKPGQYGSYKKRKEKNNSYGGSDEETSKKSKEKTVERPRLFNKKLFEFDEENNRLKVKKSKLISNHRKNVGKENEKKIRENLDLRRRGRRQTNIGFLLNELFKENDLKQILKTNCEVNFAMMIEQNLNEDKKWDFSKNISTIPKIIKESQEKNISHSISKTQIISKPEKIQNKTDLIQKKKKLFKLSEIEPYDIDIDLDDLLFVEIDYEKKNNLQKNEDLELNCNADINSINNAFQVEITEDKTAEEKVFLEFDEELKKKKKNEIISEFYENIYNCEKKIEVEKINQIQEKNIKKDFKIRDSSSKLNKTEELFKQSKEETNKLEKKQKSIDIITKSNAAIEKKTPIINEKDKKYKKKESETKFFSQKIQSKEISQINIDQSPINIQEKEKLVSSNPKKPLILFKKPDQKIKFESKPTKSSLTKKLNKSDEEYFKPKSVIKPKNPIEKIEIKEKRKKKESFLEQESFWITENRRTQTFVIESSSSEERKKSNSESKSRSHSRSRSQSKKKFNKDFIHKNDFMEIHDDSEEKQSDNQYLDCVNIVIEDSQTEESLE